MLSFLRAHVINSETKQANQTQTCMIIGKQRDIHKDRIVNIQASIGFKTNENFDLVRRLIN